MANAPHEGGTARVIELIWVKREAEYFCEQGWTEKCPSGKSALPDRHPMATVLPFFLFPPCLVTRMARVTRLSCFVGKVSSFTEKDVEWA
jgi:hypothetical protein